MKPAIRITIYGLIAYAITWILVISTNSVATPCGPSGPFVILFVALNMTYGISTDFLGIKSEPFILSSSALVFIAISGSVIYAILAALKPRSKKH